MSTHLFVVIVLQCCSFGLHSPHHSRHPSLPMGQQPAIKAQMVDETKQEQGQYYVPHASSHHNVAPVAIVASKDGGYYGSGGPPAAGMAATTTLPIYYSADPSPITDDHSLCQRACCSKFWRWAILYILLIIITAFLAGIVPAVGITLLGVLPSVFFLVYLRRSYYKNVLRSQMVWTFFESICWMSLIGEWWWWWW